MISLQELKRYSGAELEGMVLLSKGRLSVQPVSSAHWDFILDLENKKPAES